MTHEEKSAVSVLAVLALCVLAFVAVALGAFQ
jgi:hypothetical protein